MRKSLLLIVYFFLFFLCKETYKFNPSFITHPNDASKKVEYYIKKTLGEGLFPAIIFIHGHQNGLNPGGKHFVNWGMLDQFANQGFIAVAISQPGYGASAVCY